MFVSRQRVVLLMMAILVFSVLIREVHAAQNCDPLLSKEVCIEEARTQNDDLMPVSRISVENEDDDTSKDNDDDDDDDDENPRIVVLGH